MALAALALAVAAPARASAPVGFSFHASNITGISTGSAFLTGGGAFDPAGASVQAGGGFRCTNTIAQAPFAGCQAGQGVRWDTSGLLPSTMFKCTAAESPRAISTDAHTVVLAADFYRAVWPASASALDGGRRRVREDCRTLRRGRHEEALGV